MNKSQTTKGNKYSVIVTKIKPNNYIECQLTNHEDDSDTVVTKFRKNSESTKEVYEKILLALNDWNNNEILEEGGILLGNTTLIGQIIIAVV